MSLEDSSRGRSQRPQSQHNFQRRVISEETPLLAAATDHPFAHHGTSSPDETLHDDELEDDIDPNEFEAMLTKSVSWSSGMGMEPGSQENSMMRGERRRSSVAWNGRRRSFASTTGSGINEEDEDEETNRSPYIGGMSRGRFWLIYAGILSNLVSTFSCSTSNIPC
jgi:hypothetical protein